MGFFNKEKDFNKIKGENLIEWKEPNGEGCVVSDSNNFEEDNGTKPIYVEKQRKGDHHGYKRKDNTGND